MDANQIDVDFFAGESWDHEMPARTRWLRENEPVFWSEKTGMWIATKFDDVVHVSRHHEVFCSGEGVRRAPPLFRLPLVDEDEPQHQRLRQLVNSGFTPRMIKKLEDVFRQITTDAIDAVAEQGKCDFVDDIAVPVALLLLAEMIGIRPEDREDFHRWSDVMMLADGFDDPQKIATAGAAFREYAAYCDALVENRRREPRDDLLSILGPAYAAGLPGPGEGRFPPLNMFCVVLLVAGNETTRNGISGGMQLLIENPEARQRLIANRSLIPSAVEEMLRLISPVLNSARTATRDTELRDKQIKRGDKVLMLYSSANRDAEVFEDPDRFDIERNPHHVAFGFGNHYCLGASLARMQMRVAFAELLRRLPDMQYAKDGPEFAPSPLFPSVQHMYVRFTAERAAA